MQLMTEFALSYGWTCACQILVNWTIIFSASDMFWTTRPIRYETNVIFNVSFVCMCVCEREATIECSGLMGLKSELASVLLHSLEIFSQFSAICLISLCSVCMRNLWIYLYFTYYYFPWLFAAKSAIYIWRYEFVCYCWRMNIRRSHWKSSKNIHNVLTLTIILFSLVQITLKYLQYLIFEESIRLIEWVIFVFNCCWCWRKCVCFRNNIVLLFLFLFPFLWIFFEASAFILN